MQNQNIQKINYKGKVMNVAVSPKSAVAQKYKNVIEKFHIQPSALAPGFGPTPFNDLVFSGGKTIPNLSFANFYIGNWKQSDIASIDWAISAAMSDPNLNNVIQQYFKENITNTFKGSSILDQIHPTTFSKSDVEKLVLELYKQRKFDSYDLGNTIFNFVLPRGTILSDSDGSQESTKTINTNATSNQINNQGFTPVEEEASDSLHGLGGYHGSVIIEGGSNEPNKIYYSVDVYSEVLPNGSENGIAVFDESWKNIVATLYHEITEFKTDPDVEEGNKLGDSRLFGWVSNEGEIGDIPIDEARPITKVFKEVPLTNDSRRVPIQLMYSNWVHGPEGPIPTPHN